MAGGTLQRVWEQKDVGFVFVLLLVGVFALLFGGGLVFEHNGAVQENRPVEAVVESTSVDHRVIENSDGPDEDEYRPVVVYTYTVDGREYEQDNVFPGSFERWRESQAWARRIAGEYAAGETVTAHYNPRNPGHAYIRNDGWPGEWLVTAGYAVVLVLAGAWLIRRGFERRRQRQLMEDTPTEQAESLSMGPSEVSGVARLHDDHPASAPFTDDECVVAVWEVEEYHEDDDGGDWHTVARGIEGVPFHVDDGTGKVLVRPHVDAMYELDPADETTARVDAGEEPPGPIRAFVESSTDVDPVTESAEAGNSEGDRRYTQNLVRPGEEVYVYGSVQPREGATGTSNVENLVIQKVPEADRTQEPMFLIADRPESALIEAREWALWRLPVGIVAITGGVGLLLGIFGPPAGLPLPVLGLFGTVPAWVPVVALG